MIRYIQVILVLALCVASSYQQNGCYWTGCQPKTWAQRGCFPADKVIQKNSRGCSGGNEYFCCPNSGGGGGKPPPGGGGGKPAESGICSWYGAVGEIPEGHPTASGQPFHRLAMTAAHKTLPFGTRIRVKNEKNGKTVDVVINDRGPFVPGRIVDLTYAAFGVFANRDDGTVPCSYTILK